MTVTSLERSLLDGYRLTKVFNTEPLAEGLKISQSFLETTSLE